MNAFSEDELASVRRITRSDLTVTGKGTFTEEEFWDAMNSAFQYGGSPRPSLVVSRGQLLAARAVAAEADADAERAYTDYLLLSRGWRRIRVVKRLRALRRYAERKMFAESMWATFGRDR